MSSPKILLLCREEVYCVIAHVYCLCRCHEAPRYMKPMNRALRLTNHNNSHSRPEIRTHRRSGLSKRVCTPMEDLRSFPPPTPPTCAAFAPACTDNAPHVRALAAVIPFTIMIIGHESKSRVKPFASVYTGDYCRFYFSYSRISSRAPRVTALYRAFKRVRILSWTAILFFESLASTKNLIHFLAVELSLEMYTTSASCKFCKSLPLVSFLLLFSNFLLLC